MRKLIAKLFGNDQWVNAGQKWQGLATELQLSGWTQKRRVVVLRRPLREGVADEKNSPKKAAKQLTLDLPEATHQGVLYEYAVLVTSMQDEVLAIAPTYRQEEIDRIFAQCDAAEKAAFATLLLTGLRDEELCFLTWADVDLANADDATVRVSGEGKPGFSPKDYEERVLPIPSELAALVGKLPRTTTWVFPTSTGNRQTHLLRRLKEIAEAAKVANATLHKFRHTYATRLLESGCDIVTVQKLMGHSDIETTRQYLDPDEKLKRKAVNKLSLKAQ